MTQEVNAGSSGEIEARDEYCGCGLECDDRDPSVPNCGDRHDLPSGFTLMCTREKGHDGPHAGCSASEHPRGAWK